MQRIVTCSTRKNKGRKHENSDRDDDYGDDDDDYVSKSEYRKKKTELFYVKEKFVLCHDLEDKLILDKVP